MNNMFTRFHSEVQAGILALVLVVLSIGCGGGTTGTGGTSTSELRGNILDNSGAPVTGASVLVLETGESTVSNNEGTFSLESELLSSNLTIVVETAASEARATINEIPIQPVIIEVILELDDDSKTVEIKEKKITLRPTPTPTSVVAPSITPTQTTIPEPTQIPPAPNATPSQTPTTIPTETPETPVSPTTTPTFTATPRRAIYSGIISTENSSLLESASIRVQNLTSFKPINLDGTFRFKGLVDPNFPTLVLKSGTRTAKVTLSGITERTTHIEVILKLSQRPAGGLILEIDSQNIY